MSPYAVAAAIAALSGCAATPGPGDRWYAATGLYPSPGSVTRVADADTIPCGALARAVGCTVNGTDVRIAAASAYADRALLHEYGHVLGASHTHHGVMAPSISAATECITAEDIAAIPRPTPWARPECP